MHKNIHPLLVAVINLASVACGKPPQAQVDAANAALAKARAAGATEYAPEAYSAAHDAVAKLDAELKTQGGKFALTRAYEEATRLAATATAAAERAALDAVQRKQAAETDALTVVVEARAAIQDAETALSRAPKGTGSKVDLEVLQCDLTVAQSALGEAQAAFNSEHFRDVGAKAKTAQERATAVKSAIDQAIQSRQGAAARTSHVGIAVKRVEAGSSAPQHRARRDH